MVRNKINKNRISQNNDRLKILSIFFLISMITLAIADLYGQDFPYYRKRLNQVNQKEYDETDILAEVTYGNDMAARILGIYPLHKSKALNDYVAELGQGITALTGRTDITYNFAVLNTNDVNAYSCPGGNVFITKGAIDLMDDEAQLVGVLSHEIGHIDHKHMVKKLKIRGQNSVLASSMANIIGGTDNTFRIILGKLMDKGIETLFNEGYPKEDEFESDTTSIKTLVSLNYDWKSYGRYLEKVKQVIVQDKEAGKKLEKTHPPMNERLKSIKKFIESNNLQSTKGRKNETRFKRITQRV